MLLVYGQKFRLQPVTLGHVRAKSGTCTYLSIWTERAAAIWACTAMSGQR